MHRKSGMVFVYAMVALSLTGVVMATIKHKPSSQIGGSLTFYLATTALFTVRRRPREFPWIDIAGTLVGIAVGLFAIKFGFIGVNSPSGKIDGNPPASMFIFAGVALLAASGDVRVILAGPLQGARRLARHLWRMCFALLIASFSFFLGQAKVVPKPVRIMPVLSIPVVVVFLMMVYWLVRMLFTRWHPLRVKDLSAGAHGMSSR